MRKLFLMLMLLCSATLGISQTLYVPNFTTNGIASSPNNNVGIGTSSPSVKLDISGTVQGSNMGRFKGWTTGGESGLGFEIGTSSGEGYAYVYDRTSQSYGTMHLQNAIHTSGNNGEVGIGVVTPQSKLHIKDDRGSASLIVQGKQDGNVGNYSELILSTEFSIANNVSGTQTGRKSLIRATAGSAWGTNVRLGFFTSSSDGSYPIERMVVAPNGNVGVGTTAPDAKLTVKGDIHTREIKVDMNGAVAPDYVFASDYDLRTLEETEQYIQIHKHLPEIQSADDMDKNGFELKEMNLKLLQKVEELTLYLIEQNKEIKTQKEEVKVLKERISQLENE